MTKIKDDPRCAGHSDLDAYCGGFFDGEGCVSIHRRKSGGIQIVISAYQTLEAPLQLFKRRFGGKIIANKKRPRRKQSWTWYAYGKDAFYSLSRMLPWLIVKRKKAKLALAILKYQPIKGEATSRYQMRALGMILGKYFHD